MKVHSREELEEQVDARLGTRRVLPRHQVFITNRIRRPIRAAVKLATELSELRLKKHRNLFVESDGGFLGVRKTRSLSPCEQRRTIRLFTRQQGNRTVTIRRDGLPSRVLRFNHRRELGIIQEVGTRTVTAREVNPIVFRLIDISELFRILERRQGVFIRVKRFAIIRKEIPRLGRGIYRDDAPRDGHDFDSHSRVLHRIKRRRDFFQPRPRRRARHRIRTRAHEHYFLRRHFAALPLRSSARVSRRTLVCVGSRIGPGSVQWKRTEEASFLTVNPTII